MMTKTTLLSLSLMLSAASFQPSLSYAETTGDGQAGEKSATVCAGCHGSKGQSQSGQFPNLAAQQNNYLINQLTAFKSGSRINSMMQAIAANLNEADIANLAAYFSSLPAVSSGGDPVLAKTGQEKAAMCLGCHGQKGEGRGAFPRLAGQQPDYLVTQLNNFKQGNRKAGSMEAVAGNLSDSDMAALAAFFASM